MVYDVTSHMSITNPVVRLEAYEQTSRERHVHVGPLNITSTNCVFSSGNVRSPHEYLTPLLTDTCRSTVGPRGWEPQQCVLPCVPRQ